MFPLKTTSQKGRVTIKLYKTMEEFEKTEEETIETETSGEEGKTSKKPDADLENLNKQLYARTKKAEESQKRLEAEMEVLKAKMPANTPITMDAEEIANLSAVFDGLSQKERTRLIQETKVKDLEINSKNLAETKIDENFSLWLKSYREKVEKENAPLPSTAQSGTGGKIQFKDLTPEEQKEYLQEKGYMRKWGNPKVPERTT